MRLALVTETYPPEVNGVALTFHRLVEGLRARHHHIQLIRPRQAGDVSLSVDEHFHEVLVRSVPIPRYPDLRMGVPSQKELVALWEQWRPDLVHIVTEGPLGWSALRAADRLGLPVCSDFRTNFHAYSRYYGLGWLHRPITAYLRWFHNRCAFTVVPTEQLKRDLGDIGFKRLVIVTRGVDTALFDPARRNEELRRQWGAQPHSLVALYVGRLAREKNLGMLAAAYRAMKQANPSMRLVVVGDGPARGELRELVPEAIFAGARFGEELATYYACADLFIFPSMTETFGNVTVEAMASGLPVLAYDHAAAGQLIRDGDNGVLADTGEKFDFIRKAVQLVADRDVMRRMGQEARRTASELGWDRIVTRVESVFLAAMATGTQAHDAEAPAPGIQGVGTHLV